MQSSRIHCPGKPAMLEAIWIANHEDVIIYENAWKLISKDKYVEVMLTSAE